MTNRYRVVFGTSALKQLEAFSDTVRRRIVRKVEQLGENPRSENAVKLAGHDNTYRIRVGNYRVI